MVNKLNIGLMSLMMTLKLRPYSLLIVLFFCHLSVEKLLKAFVVRNTREFPPKIHNLNRLLELSGVELDNTALKLLDILMIYQIEGRYPNHYPSPPMGDLPNEVLESTKSLLLCLKQRL